MQRSKTDLIRKLAKTHRRSHQHYAAAFNEIFAGVREELGHGHSVNILDFGTFVARPVPERKTRHIRTKQMITVPAHQCVGFRPGDRLRKAVNRSRPGTATKRRGSTLKRLLGKHKLCGTPPPLLSTPNGNPPLSLLHAPIEMECFG
jgi:nucleoid DNA-binding protein